MIPFSERPYIFINSAMSADGKLSTFERKQVKISGKADFDRVDTLRAGTDAIMVGIGTVLADNPSLTVKSEQRRLERTAAGKEENPIRVIVDSNARTPIDADIFKKGKGRKIIVVSESAQKEKTAALSKMPDTKIIVAGSDRVNLEEMAVLLKKEGINRLMVEGGATLNYGLISVGLVDELMIFVGNLIIGGKTAPTFADGDGFSEGQIRRLTLESAEKIEDGILLTWKMKSE
ncbi:2,5-diamino-6-(ribosylamino)-4(3H)-pyrimidinone 5'-phosphate reductase [Methanimicrococcus blatticola]|uniref:2,5-diamino-6-(ribosylamino)-4(3H)-pyrimidinone 5'-phosphate reductase n=1 Tax=Methanimicrococcus blatticola TaxID=91560 RepID=A0A484F5Z8_9EURY|nr:2,5-diamino-6-(ribosylamino)-4(3H)-pyrimidinone 5'-phosphate reductase [Methanimicrococcus blatticola]MBZ3935023.1 2,5-diamino-6-(ribosylamino)-4(3H)-pyrimidinone 5'-phosphate reductase [Methanimicrococcus blatticola]MCC2508879.1 2,5-diamino-6-(ribosylamino)-4(3H)-pyrimidinone 5'-phosphate reductase [Methanimicrococcus blatticola]TDQ71094.1 2,5-diamino-6-(5-phosphoribosylamino)pyrimidin-4(3H)-one reductase [Methanimicrococcus blatticola]